MRYKVLSPKEITVKREEHGGGCQKGQKSTKSGEGSWQRVQGMCRGGGIWGRKIPAGLALRLADILSTDRSLGWNLAWSRNRRRGEMVSDIPDGKKKKK